MQKLSISGPNRTIVPSEPIRCAVYIMLDRSRTRLQPALVYLAWWIASLSLVHAQEDSATTRTQPQIVLNENGHHAPVWQIRFSPDSKRLFTSGLDRSILEWAIPSQVEPKGKLVRTIRPYIWAGRQGQILGMTVFKFADKEWLVAGGYGTQQGAGDISRFDLSGPQEPNGGKLTSVWRGLDDAGKPIGHFQGVAALGMATTNGRPVVVSLGQEGNILFWDLDRNTVFRTMSDGPPTQLKQSRAWRPSQALAVDPLGRFVVAGDEEGVIRLWDLSRESDQAPIVNKKAYGLNAKKIDDHTVTSLAISPDRGTLMVGLSRPLAFPLPNNEPPSNKKRSGLRIYSITESNGMIGLQLRSTPSFFRPGAMAGDNNPFLGEVSAIAYRPQGDVFAVAVDDRLPGKESPADVSTWIELRSATTGEVIDRIGPEPGKPWPGLIQTLAFSPDGRWLAFADGDQRRIHLQEFPVNPAQPRPPLVTLRSRDDVQGATVWKVGLRGEGAEQLGFWTGGPISKKDKAAPFRGFDLMKGQSIEVAEADMTQPLYDFNGWTVRPSGLKTLTITCPDMTQFTLRIDSMTVGDWFSYTLLPQEGDRKNVCLAVGGQYGIGIYRLEPGKAELTRFLRGHSGDVVSLAPSRDFKWLVSGSADQTIRLWLTADFDQRKGLGATFKQADGRWVVDLVQPRSPAALGGLQAGDAIIRAYRVEEGKVEPKELPVDANLQAMLDGNPPGRLIQMELERAGQKQFFGTSKYDNPTLNLFVDAAEKDWVVWMPAGYYETSIAGDRTLIGWQVNNGSVLDPAPIKAPSYFPLSQFEKPQGDRPGLRRPDVIKNLIAGADVAAALQAANLPAVPALGNDLPIQVAVTPQGAGNIQPPALGEDAFRIAPGIINLPINLEFRAFDGKRKVSRIAWDDEGITEFERTFDPPLDPTVNGGVLKDQDLVFRIGPGRRTKTIKITSDTGSVWKSRWLYQGEPDSAPPRDAQLRILAFRPTFDKDSGLEWDGNLELPATAGTELQTHLVQPYSTEMYSKAGSNLVLPKEATVSGLRKWLSQLREEVDEGQLGLKSKFDEAAIKAGLTRDTVCLVLDTHVLEHKSDRLILGSDFDPERPERTGLKGGEFAERLAELVQHGCRVVVFLDGVHEVEAKVDMDVNELIRDLSKVGVVVYTASQDRLTSQTDVFSQAIAEALKEQARKPEFLNPVQFSEEVEKKVKALSDRGRQKARFVASELFWDVLPLVKH